jgi:type I restriction enzyme M protein
LRIGENGATKSARDAQSRTDAIDAAVFDLKAVNPNVVAKVDARTPAEIIENIAAQGRIVSSALDKLKSLMAAGDS